MNLASKLTENDMKLLNNVGINIGNKEYSVEELAKFESKIADYIMNESTKEKDISMLLNQYNRVLNILDSDIDNHYLPIEDKNQLS